MLQDQQKQREEKKEALTKNKIISDDIEYTYFYSSYSAVIVSSFIPLNFELSTFNRYSAVGVDYFHDGLGSIIAIYNRDTLVQNTYLYDDFGNIVLKTENIENHYLYTGQELDKEIIPNLYNLRNRYYDTNIGRFTQEDPLQQISEFPQYNNRYVYVVNNPLNFTDILGLGVCVPIFSLFWWRIRCEVPVGGTSSWKLYLYEFESGSAGAIGPPWYTLKCYWVKFMKYFQLLQRIKKTILVCTKEGCEEEIYFKTEKVPLPIYKTRNIEKIVADMWTQKLTISPGEGLECISSKLLNPNLW